MGIANLRPNMNTATAADVDVVIPLFNGERYIGEALRSVLGQTMAPRHVFVVNDGSTDSSAQRVQEVVSEYSGSTVVTCLNKSNGGLSSARNHGLSLCTARYVAFLDADDAWMPTKLEEQLAIFASSPVKDLGLVHCGYHAIDADGRVLPHERIIHPDPGLRGDVFSRLLIANRISGSGSGVLVLRTLLETTGGFDENLKAAEDWDLWLRLAKRCGFDHAPLDLAAIRRHGESMQTDRAHMLRNLLSFFIKWFPEARTRPEVLNHWSHVIAEFILRSNVPAAARSMVKGTLPGRMRRRLFHRTLGSIRLHVWLKSLRSPRPENPLP